MNREPTLGDVLRDFWRARLWLLAGALAGVLGAAIFLNLAVPQFRATMLVAPTTRSGTPDISALFPDNASFTMEYVLQSFGPSDSSDFMRFETILREQTVAGLLLQDESVRKGLLQADRFNISSVGAPRTAPELAAWLHDNLRVEPVGSTRLRRIVFLHPDPRFAVYFLRRLYDITDNLIRHELQQKTVARVDWLRKALEETTHPEHRRVVTNLLMDQEQIRMILAVDEPFSALLAEPPAAGPKPYWPRRSIVFPAFLFAGLFLGYAAWSLRRPPRA